MGSYVSDTAAVLLSRPVASVVGVVSSDPEKLTITQERFSLDACVVYDGVGLPIVLGKCSARFARAFSVQRAVELVSQIFVSIHFLVYTMSNIGAMSNIDSK